MCYTKKEGETMDTKILDFIAKNMRSDWLDFLMKVFTFIGEAGIFGIAIAILCLCFKNYRKTGMYILITMALGFLIGNLLLKNVIARDRPCVVHPELVHTISCPSGYSMPSGHTLHSFIPAFVLLFNKKWKSGIITFVLASLIAFSRMYFYVHYPSDILFGFLLAALLSFVVWILFTKVKKLNQLFFKEG